MDSEKLVYGDLTSDRRLYLDAVFANTSADLPLSAKGGWAATPRGFFDQIGERMRCTLKHYTETVIGTEWPMKRQDEVAEYGGDIITSLLGT
jgi:hypothetical protein